MEHASRGDRFASLGIVLLGVVVLCVIVFALKDPQSSQAAPTTTTTTRTVAPPAARHSAVPSSSVSSSSPAPSSTSHAPRPPVKDTPLVVMNNTSTTGLAALAQTQFENAGWTVTSIGTMSNNIVSTAAYYDPAVPTARRAALALQRAFPTIKRVVPRFPELAAGPVVVVLAWDYTAS